MNDSSPFAELPSALVEDVLAKSQSFGKVLLEKLAQMKEQRTVLRQRLSDGGLLRKDADLPAAVSLPTTCAADGSYAVERLLTVDLAAAAAVAVEGLTPPSETRYWPEPRHKSLVFYESHSQHTDTILRSIMLGEELDLACQAPHDMVLLDFTLTLPIIYFNQGFSARREESKMEMAKNLRDNSERMLKCYAEILESHRGDKQYAGIPKYSTRREIADYLKLDAPYDDRGMLTLVMEAGEYTQAMALETRQGQDWHLSVSGLPKETEPLKEKILRLLPNLRVLYYKPHTWLPALRLEIPQSTAENTHRLATVLHGIKHQCATPSMLEPYPLYMADRFVKALARAVPAFRHVTTQRIAEDYSGDVGEIFFAMHGFRSERGQ